MQSDYVISPNPSGLAQRLEINEMIMALLSLSGGNTDPETTIRNMMFFDEANDIIKIRNSSNDGWDTVFKLTAAQASKLATARTINGVSFDGSANINIEDRKGSNIASAATISIGTPGIGEYIHITGTTTITSFGTASSAGIRRTLIFDGALTITHNASTLICVGNSNIVTVANTVIEVVAETTTSWRVVSIMHPALSMKNLGYLIGVTSDIQTQFNNKASLSGATFTGNVIVPDGTSDDHAINLKQLQDYVSNYTQSGTSQFTTSGTFTVPAGVRLISVIIQAPGGAGGSGVGGQGGNNSSGGSGGSGAYSEGIYIVNPGSTYTVTIGSSCSFGSLITGVKSGGNGGNGGVGVGGTAGAAGIAGTGGLLNEPGTTGTAGYVTSYPSGRPGAASHMATATTATAVGVQGENGHAYGGGGGSGGAAAGGSGGPGYCKVKW